MAHILSWYEQPILPRPEWLFYPWKWPQFIAGRQHYQTGDKVDSDPSWTCWTVSYFFLHRLSFTHTILAPSFLLPFLIEGRVVFYFCFPLACDIWLISSISGRVGSTSRLCWRRLVSSQTTICRSSFHSMRLRLHSLTAWTVPSRVFRSGLMLWTAE